MLFRRLYNHLSSQNSTALFLDFLIVVAGLFIGLQLDGWNEDRKNAIREKEHLEVNFTATLAYGNTLGVLANARRTHSQIAQSRYQLRGLILEASNLIESSLGKTSRLESVK